MAEIATMHFSNFGSLYAFFYKKAFLFTRSYVYNDMVAEDIVSESLIKLWGQIRDTNVENVNALLLTILKNKALDYLKHEQVKERAFKDLTNFAREELEMRTAMLESCDPKEVFSADIRCIMEKTLQCLPGESRQIFEMSRFGSKTNKEIAEELGVSVKNVEYHITRTLKALRINLKDYLPQIILFLLIWLYC